MRWLKRGLLFDPHQHQLPDGCTSFAQSPQALVFDDFVRIYFSTRRREETGQYLSYISFVDVDRSLQRILGTASASVMPLGEMGCFDEHGIFPINVVRHGGKVHAYTCGWSRRVSVPVETAIGRAISYDAGVTFERMGPGPVMGPAPAEPFLVGDPFVVIRDGRWHMWYIFATSWTPAPPTEEGPVRVYKIAYASSTDGMSWQRDAVPIMTDTLGPDECQALPTVFECDGAWHMYFCYRHATGFRVDPDRAYRLGYARSTDMQRWTRDDASGGIDVSPSGWDSDMLCYPHVFWCGEQAYLLYNGNEFGRSGFGVAVLEGMNPVERDYDRELRDTPDRKYAYTFDLDVMHPFMLRSFVPFFRPGGLLELGSFKGEFTKRFLPHFSDITCVEASGEAVAAAKAALGDAVAFVHATFETVQLGRRFDNIVLTHVLEHLDDPVRVLKRVNDEWLSDTGRFFLVCPNGNAASRQIAVRMGIISHNAAVTPAEREHGHRVTYTLDTLETYAKDAGLSVLHRSGVFFKALANFQWDRLLATDIVSPEYFEGCYQLGQVYPDLCSSIFLLCERGRR